MLNSTRERRRFIITKLSEKLKEELRERNISVNEFAEICALPIETVKNIYYGRTPDPKVSTLLKMGKALNLSINCLLGECPHSKDEQRLLKNYRRCGNHGKSIITLVSKYEALSAKRERERSDKHKIPCLIPKGNIREGIVYDRCEVVDVITSVKEAYAGIKMINNDLVPLYCKNDIILIENRFPINGEIGVFYKNERAYIRRFIEDNDHYILKCLHGFGEDFIFKHLDSLEYIGTCVGVVREY